MGSERSSWQAQAEDVLALAFSPERGTFGDLRSGESRRHLGCQKEPAESMLDVDLKQLCTSLAFSPNGTNHRRLSAWRNECFGCGHRNTD